MTEKIKDGLHTEIRYGDKYEGHYKDGKKEGTWTSWYENGQKKYEDTYKNGKNHGISLSWYENGQKSAYKMYKEGMRHGITTYWNEKGEPTKQVLYENDEEVEVKTGDQIPEDLGI